MTATRLTISNSIRKFIYRWYRRQTWLGVALLALSRHYIQREGLSFYVRTPGMSIDFKASFWFDRYETAERALVRKYIHPDYPVIELGGGIGMIACVANKVLNTPAKHIVVEANPALIKVLERNKSLNNCEFEIVCAAYAATQSQVAFKLGAYYTTSHTITGVPPTEAEREILVCAGENLRRLVDKAGFTGIGLICDIEGSEYELIDAEKEVLRQYVKTFIVEMHTPPKGAMLDDYLQRLNRLGFQQVDQSQRVYVFVNRALEGS